MTQQNQGARDSTHTQSERKQHRNISSAEPFYNADITHITAQIGCLLVTGW